MPAAPFYRIVDSVHFRYRQPALLEANNLASCQSGCRTGFILLYNLWLAVLYRNHEIYCIIKNIFSGRIL